MSESAQDSFGWFADLQRRTAEAIRPLAEMQARIGATVVELPLLPNLEKVARDFMERSKALQKQFAPAAEHAAKIAKGIAIVERQSRLLEQAGLFLMQRCHCS